MRLTGRDIARYHAQGRISIDPFDESRLQSYSYDVRLGPTVRTYVRNPATLSDVLDPEEENVTVSHDVPENGLLLMPKAAMLGHTVESFGSPEFAVELHGKSTLGRLFVLVHVTAGMGDFDFGCVSSETNKPEQWTLEIVNLGDMPVRLRAGMAIAQAVFCTTSEDRSIRYAGRYKGQRGVTPARPGRA